MWVRMAQSSVKKQISDEFLNGFYMCEEMLKVEQAAVCLEADAEAICQVLFCLTEHDAEEDAEHGGGQHAPLLHTTETAEAAQQ